MNFQRAGAQRLLQCTLAALVSGALLTPALAVKPDEKPKSATKPAAAKPDQAKPSDKKAATKPVTKRPTAKATKAAAKPATKAAPDAARSVPLPRSRPQFTVASAPNPPFNLSSTPVLATSGFAPLKPAAAAVLPNGPAPAASGYLAPPTAPPAARVAAVMPTAPLAAAESRGDAGRRRGARQAGDRPRAARQDQRRGARFRARAIRSPASWSSGPILRNDENDGGFDRLAGFSNDNPSWPNATMIRRRAESALWDERTPGRDGDPSFFRTQKPDDREGQVCARPRPEGARRRGRRRGPLVRTAWREDTCSRDVERMVMETFGDALTRADHKARMDRRFYDDDPDAGMRMATLLGGNDLLIGKARKAVVEKSSNAAALLEAVPSVAPPGRLAGSPSATSSRRRPRRRSRATPRARGAANARLDGSPVAAGRRPSRIASRRPCSSCRWSGCGLSQIKTAGAARRLNWSSFLPSNRTLSEVRSRVMMQASPRHAHDGGPRWTPCSASHRSASSWPSSGSSPPNPPARTPGKASPTAFRRGPFISLRCR